MNNQLIMSLSFVQKSLLSEIQSSPKWIRPSSEAAVVLVEFGFALWTDPDSEGNSLLQITESGLAALRE